MPLKQRFQRHQHGALVVDDQDAVVLRFHHFALLVLRTCSGLQLLRLREWHAGSPTFGMPARHRKCHCRNERRRFGIVLSLQLSAVRFYDSPDAVQTKAIMSLFDVTEWFPSPILRIRRENRFWFMEREQESPIGDSGRRNQCALVAIVLESVGKKLEKYFLEQLR